jgi:hypothetical protein
LPYKIILMALKIVIDNAVLKGSLDEQFSQRVATVYSPTGEEYRVYAPPKARGKALDWRQHFSVRQPAEPGFGPADVAVKDGREHSIINQVARELERQELEADIWRSGVNPDGRYCAGQICMMGHVQSANGVAYKAGEHCQQCGEGCIDTCQGCKAPIRGNPVHATGNYEAPTFCYKCGKPYPWMQDRLQTAKELLYHDDKLSLEEREKLWGLLQYVMSDPKSDMAPAKRKLFEIGIAKALPATREFFLDLMVKLGAEMLKS